MNFVLITASILVGLFILFRIYVFVKSKKSVGDIIPFDKLNKEIAEKIKNLSANTHDKKSLIYFYSPTCRYCKKLNPIIEKLKSEFKPILSVDVSEEDKTARAFKIAGIPSIVFLGSKNIEGNFVGIRNEDFIREKLQSLT